MGAYVECLNTWRNKSSQKTVLAKIFFLEIRLGSEHASETTEPHIHRTRIQTNIFSDILPAFFYYKSYFFTTEIEHDNQFDSKKYFLVSAFFITDVVMK